MQSLTTYLFEHVGFMFENSGSPTSDNAIYFKIGMHKYKWNTKNPSKREQIDKKYHITDSNFRSGIISYAKHTSPKLLPDNQEIIHRSKWDLDGLIGETEYQLMHMHYLTFKEYVLKTHKKTKDVLTIFECSNAKPYAVQSTRNRFYCQWFKYFTDIIIMSCPGFVPLELSHFYPCRYDEWDHSVESENMVKKYNWVAASRFMEYVKKLGYKHVIVVIQNENMQKWAKMLTKMKKEYASMIHIVCDDQNGPKLIEKSYRKFDYNKGLAIQRLIQQDFFIDRYIFLLKKCLNEEDKKELDKILEIRDIESRTEKKEKLEEFNKEHNVQPYDLEHGTDKSFPLETIENITSQNKIDEYVKYVESILEDIDKRYEKSKNNKDWYDNKVVFTVLDLLMDKYNDEIIDNVDEEYWNMYQAVHKAVAHKPIYKLNDYCFCYQPLIDDIGDEDIKKYCNKVGITQFYDKRRTHPNK